MPAPIDPALKSQIKRAYLMGSPIALLAKTFNIADRTIERWAAAEKWEVERKADNVIDLAQRPPKPPRARAEVPSDALAIADLAIADLQARMTATEITGRDTAALANALRSWVEYRERIRPRTIESLVTQVILHLGEWGLSPVDFAKALRDRRSS